MRIWLLRHAIAEERSLEHPEMDEFRRLTVEGRKKLRRLLKVLTARLPRPERVLSSPYVRAAQTAEIAAKAWGLACEQLDCLAPGEDAFDWLLEQGTAGPLPLLPPARFRIRRGGPYSPLGLFPSRWMIDSNTL